MLRPRGVPDFTGPMAVDFIFQRFGIRGQVTRLPSYQDVNFRVEVEGKAEFVFKVGNFSEEVAVWKAQHAAMDLLAGRSGDYRFPRPVPTSSGEEVFAVTDTQGRPCSARMLTFVPGDVAGSQVPRPWDVTMLASIGRLAAHVTSALQGFDHPAAHRVLIWDSVNAGTTISDRLAFVALPKQRELLEVAAGRFSVIEENVAGLRRSIVHNDLNDQNLIAGPTGDSFEVKGAIDFGDLVYSITVAELSVAAAYAVLDQDDPIDAIRSVAQPFHRRVPLSALEREVLFDLIRCRLAMSVAVSAEQKRSDPENEYLSITERPAWAALARMSEYRAEEAGDMIWDG